MWLLYVAHRFEVRLREYLNEIKTPPADEAAIRLIMRMRDTMNATSEPSWSSGTLIKYDYQGKRELDQKMLKRLVAGKTLSR